MRDDEEVVKPDRIGSMDPEILNWTPPSTESRRTMKRVKEIRDWIIHENRFVHEEEIIRYCMTHFDITRHSAREYLTRVIEDFKKKDVPVLKPNEWMVKPQFEAFLSIANAERVQQNAEKWKEGSEAE